MEQRKPNDSLLYEVGKTIKATMKGWFGLYQGLYHLAKSGGKFANTYSQKKVTPRGAIKELEGKLGEKFI